MIESPVLQELLDETRAEARAEDVIRVLGTRCGPIPAQIESTIRATRDLARLNALLDAAAACEDVAAFRARLDS